MINLYKRNLLRLMDLNFIEINYILNLSSKLKYDKFIGKEIPYLNKKNIVLIFEKESTRTRCSFEVAAYDQGANVTYLDQIQSQIGYKESIKDTARILGQLYNGIQYRGYKQKTVEILAKYADVPVWNGLSDEFHPTQILSDLLTIREQLPNKQFNKIKLVYIGDARNNICNSLLEASALLGINLFLISPKHYWPDKIFFSDCLNLSKQKGGTIVITENISSGIKNADFIYTDIWVSMGENKKIWEERILLLKKYQVNMNILNQANNPDIKFLHCLPALHDESTIIGKKISKKYGLYDGIEVTNEVFNSKYSIVFLQAENRLHTIKAILVSTLLKQLI